MERNGSNQQESGRTRRSGSSTWRNNAFQGPFGSSTRMRDADDEEDALLWAAIERLPTYDRLRKGIMSNSSRGVASQIDLQELGPRDKKDLVERLVSVPETDNETFLLNLKNRLERVGIDTPKVEVRFEDLTIEAEAHVGSRALPTLFNFTVNILEGILNFLRIIPSQKKRITILQDVSGVIEPKRMTLLLGPPSSGKTTFLLALAGKLDKSLKVSGKVTYNGHELNEFVPQRTTAYVSQVDVHLGQMTVRETLEYSARFQGVGYRYEMLAELSRREKAAHIKPHPSIDLFMKAAANEGQEENIMTHYILKILGLENCADTMVGNELIRGVSGGQKKRVTTGEILVGPATVLLMDEISTGLDSSTTFQIVKNLGQFVHILDETIVISLLQPAPETYNLFDEIILLSDSEIIYQGPREHVLEFFELMGFQCPERKGVADFLQDVISYKDQQQYWMSPNQPYCFIPPKEFAKAFKSFHVGEKLEHKLARPFDKSKNHPAALVTTKYGASFNELLKACFAREVLLLKRNIFIHVFKLIQLIITTFVAMTVFLRTNFDKEVVTPDGGIYLGAIFLILSTLFFFQSPEISTTISKLPVFYKQRDLLFFPPWVYSVPNWILETPIRAFEVGVVVFCAYYVIGFDPNVERLFRQYLLLAILIEAAVCLYQFLGALSRDQTVGNTLNAFVIIVMFCLGGFVLPYDDVKKWWKWGYWCSPMMYAQTALAVNEFRGHSWSNVIPNTTDQLGVAVLKSRGIFSQSKWYWIGVGALFGFTFLFNALYTLSLAFLNPFKSYQVKVPSEAQEREQENKSVNLGMQDDEIQNNDSSMRASMGRKRSGVILPFEPHSLTFDEVWYSVDMPNEMKSQGVGEERLHLLKGVTGSFRPGVLTALMGTSGAGKTTLMDVLAGRKTGGYIEGDIRVSGYPKQQETFARISGYCEQNDIHSPNVTVYESLLYSAHLRLSHDVDSQTRKMFVEEVMDLVELTPLSGALVGLPGVNGLSLEQRKRLTIAVELVANPSIIFMDEPTSGLGTRAARIIMRAVRNIVDTGRTVACTIHQPSIDIFEAFDELFLMKRGGQEIYFGPLGNRSIDVVNYFESIEGVSKIDEGYNPATWMFEVTTVAQELSLGIDLVEIYKNSALYRRNKGLIQELSNPQLGSKQLSFHSMYAQPLSAQFAACLWKQNWSYWRNPRYNASIEGVSKIDEGYNPATWMFEVTTVAQELSLGIDLVEIYKNSALYRRNKGLIQELSNPQLGSKQLSFHSMYAQPLSAQFAACLWKQNWSYWRNPRYNAVRLLCTTIIALIIGSMFWDLGRKMTTRQDLLNAMASAYAAVQFVGVQNVFSVQPILSIERIVLYRERASRMYSVIPYTLAQIMIEIPYILVQSTTYSVIVYAMIGFEWSAAKFFWYVFFMFFSLSFYTYFGMATIAATPDIQTAGILGFEFFIIWNLFSGFIIPRKLIPIWWRWYYWICPVAWTLYGLVVSQYGDLEEVLDSGETVRDFLDNYFGFKHDFLGAIAGAMVGFVVVAAFIFIFSIKAFSFQRR